MKTQIVRLSPHQNAKVLAIYAALFSLFFVIVMAVVFTVVRPMDAHGEMVPFPLYLFVLLPVLRRARARYPTLLIQKCAASTKSRSGSATL